MTLLQADVTTLPLRPESVETILSMGMLHLFEDAVGHVEQLLHLLGPGGALFATSLVAERAIGRQYLRLLHRAGEVATPRTYTEFRQSLTSTLDHAVETDRKGSMAFLTVQTS